MLSFKHICKYMRLAKQIGEDNNPCGSRAIGAVIIKETRNSTRILGTGYNGPAPKVPHADSKEWLSEVFWFALTYDEKQSLAWSLGYSGSFDHVEVRTSFLEKYVDSGICPRRIIKAASGERSELCPCGHAERHAITNAACDCDDAIMFCWCPVPCQQCADSIVHSGIKEVHCLSVSPDYDIGGRWTLSTGGVQIVEHQEIEVD